MGRRPLFVDLDIGQVTQSHLHSHRQDYILHGIKSRAGTFLHDIRLLLAHCNLIKLQVCHDISSLLQPMRFVHRQCLGVEVCMLTDYLQSHWLTQAATHVMS